MGEYKDGEGNTSCLRSLLYRCVSSPDDTPLEHLRKEVLVWLHLTWFVGNLLGFASGVGPSGAKFMMYECMIFTAISAASFLYLLIRRKVTMSYIQVVVALLTMDIMAVEVQFRVTSLTMWALFIVVVDSLLIMRVPNKMASALVGFFFVFLMVVHTEDWQRFGLYDLPGLGSYETRKSYTDCAKPPCARTFTKTIPVAVMQLLVFVFDFLVTRGFADQVEREKERIEASVEAARNIASSLALFDLEAARSFLESNGDDLPPDLLASLNTLLNNLRKYKPYLPDSLFDTLHCGDEAESTKARARDDAAPGMGSSYACLAFTDIVGSTGLWLASPEGMAKALVLHNALVRDCLRTHEGYEVKTIGDAFMVAFDDVAHAMRFGFDVQLGLLQERWPANLLQLKQCERDDMGLWGGLTLRIGIHPGEVTLERNPVTSRLDYFGTTVNTAARCESASAHGAVTMLEGVFDNLPMETRQLAAVQRLGATKLKGIGDVPLVSLFPPSLAMRSSGRVMGRLGNNATLPRAASATPAPGLPPRPSEAHSLRSTSLASTSPSVPLDIGVRVIPAATVAHVELAIKDDWEVSSHGPWQSSASFLLSLVERCKGKALAIVGRSVVISWNASLPCPTHVDNCFKLFESLQEGLSYSLNWDSERTDGSAGFAYNMGCSTGKVAVGALGRDTQLFMNVAGDCAYLSRRLGEVARLVNEPCLYSNLLGSSAIPKYLISRLEVWDDWRKYEGTTMNTHAVHRVAIREERDTPDY